MSYEQIEKTDLFWFTISVSHLDDTPDTTQQKT